MVEGAKTCGCRGKALIWAQDTETSALPSNPAIRRFTVQPAEARPGRMTRHPEVSPPALSSFLSCTKAQEFGVGVSAKVVLVQNRKVILFGEAGKHYIHLDFYCWFWTSPPSVGAGRWAQEAGKQGQGTFNGAPLGLPSKDSSSINLVLLVTAHHCKWDHFLRKEKKKKKVTFSS